jgi:phage shock protein PspC (stress-responsive transcriptional regulator)
VKEIDVAHTMRDFWATRPARPARRADDRKIAGVAAALSRRYAIDPVLVRVAFVVTTLWGGAGMLLYLLGWLLLPTRGDEVSGPHSILGRGRGSMSAALMIVLVLLLIPTAAAVFGGHPTGLLGFLAAIGALVLLHHSRAALGEIPGLPAAEHTPKAAAQHAPEAAPATGSPTAPGGLETTAPRTAASETAVPTANLTADGPAPPAWDPLGAAPFAWDLPEPSAPPSPASAPRGASSKITPVTLGLALLTGGIALAFWPTLPAVKVAALPLGVVGLGLLVGSRRQGGRGLIPVAMALALLTWVLQAAPSATFTIGDSYWDPVTAAQVQPRYAVIVGNGRLDLRGLRLTDGQTVTTSIVVGVGETHVLLPPNIDAQVSCQTEVGGVHCLGQRGSGRPEQVKVTSNGLDGPGGGMLILDVHSGVGQVHVERAS